MHRVSRSTASPTVGADSFASEFDSETDLVPVRVGEPGRSRVATGRLVLVALSFLVLGAAGGWLAATGWADRRPTVRIESDVPRVVVQVDGKPRGTTPLELTLDPGSHTFAVGEGQSATVRPVELNAGDRAMVFLLAAPPDPATASDAAAATGAVSVTDPVGAFVSLDGVERGAAPLVLGDLTPGDHQLVVRHRGVVYRRAVSVQPGMTATVLVGDTPVGAAGWLEVTSPVVLRIRENGRVLGSTDAERLMMPVGDHQLELANESLGFQIARMVRITAGQTASMSVAVPNAPLNINALPWAEVWLDNERIGETPIANHQLPIGEHQLEFRHPELGRRQATVRVTVNGPNRVSANMRTP